MREPPPRRPASYADIEALPEHLLGEIIDGSWWSEAGWVLAESFSDDDKVKAEPFEAAEIDLLELWGEERPAGEPTAG